MAIHEKKNGSKTVTDKNGKIKGNIGAGKAKTPTSASKAKNTVTKEATTISKSQVKTIKKEANLLDYSLWEPILDIDVVRTKTWKDMGGNTNSNFNFNKMDKLIAKAMLPDLSEATSEEITSLIQRLASFDDRRFNQLIYTLREEIAMRLTTDRGEAGVADLEKATNWLEGKLAEQNSGYTAAGFLQMRLKGVQEDLADPTTWDVTVKVPSGHEIALSKPEARAILISAGITPAATRPYEPIWPKKN